MHETDRYDTYNRIRDSFYWAVMIGCVGAIFGGLAIAMLIKIHLGWSSICVALCIAFLLWANWFWQKGVNLLWEMTGSSYLNEKYPAGNADGKGCS